MSTFLRRKLWTTMDCKGGKEFLWYWRSISTIQKRRGTVKIIEKNWFQILWQIWIVNI